MEENIESGGFIFYNKFDSANLAKVEKVETNKAENAKSENNKSQKNSSSESPSHEFNIWTKHDCHGTEFQNNNKTWFYFGIKAPEQGVYVKLNLMNLNKQVKMFSQGMCPVFKVIPGHPHWERIKEKPTFIADDKNNEFVLSFNYRTSDNANAVTFFAFTYPFSYADLQNYLKKIDAKMAKQKSKLVDDIYYHRECVIQSLEGRRLDVLTISSYYNILTKREAKFKDLLPDNEERPFKFQDKKIIFLSARVHPGETPSSFVLNGFINLLLNREDQIAIALRRLYVFKLIPMLNPDGVAQGYYRMDTKGVNLNRLYLNPSKTDHPTIFAAKTLLSYYHNSYSMSEESKSDITNLNIKKSFDTASSINTISSETHKLLQRVTLMSLEEKNKCIEQGSRVRNVLVKNQSYLENQSAASTIQQSPQKGDSSEDSGIFLYIDFHGHASKKGIFMYGNHFDDPEESSACMLLPKLMSINNPNFHFTSCNFAEKNMYLVDKRDGMSREGSGRVAVYKLTGLVHSYTLECNYNTGRLVNTLPARVKEGLHKVHGQLFVPPKYNPLVFEEVGAALGPSILDMTNSNPNSRLPNTQYRSLKGLKSYLKLISANHFQSSLNKPLHKKNGGDQARNVQVSASEEAIDKSAKLSKTSSVNSSLESTNSTSKTSRTANNTGTIKKVKNTKTPTKTSGRNFTNSKFTTENKTTKRETKVIVSKIISTQKQPQRKLSLPTHKKIIPKAKPNLSIKRQTSSKDKTAEQIVKVQSPIKNIVKKPTVCTKRTIIKKNCSKKSKANVQSNRSDSLKKSNIKVLVSLQDKENPKHNFITNNKKPSAKSDKKSPKKKSSSASI